MTPEEARDRLQQVASQAEPWPLAEAALLLGVDEYPGLEPAPYLARLAALAERVRVCACGARALAEEAGEVERDALLHVLLAEEGYAGNAGEYYDPRNSYLNEVIDRRQGIPITLSVVALSVARLADLPLAGVNFPGHFLIRWEREGEPDYLDLFDAGARLTEADLRARWERVVGGLPWDERVLEPAADRQILLRMLNNLKMIYARSRRYPQAIAVVEKMLLFDPLTPEHHRALGYLYGAARVLGKAIESLERYLALAPDAPDAEEVRRQLRLLSNAVSRRN